VTGNPRRLRSASPALLPSLVALGLLLVVWAATTGPVGVLSPSGRVVRPDRTSGDAATSTATPPEQPTLRETTKDVELKFDLSWLGDLITYGFFLALAVGVVLAARWLWQNRWRPPPKPVETEFAVLPDADQLAEAVRDDRSRQLAAVADGSPRNGIVACWLSLETSVRAAGVQPHPSDTSTEFVVRVLHSLDLDPRAVSRLAALYREARFSEHELGEDARVEARSALDRLHDELRDRRPVR
jgi:hypothetical protein